jgi:aspartyl protease family protein
MFGRVIVSAAVVVALALVSSSFLLNRLPEPAPASAAGATGAVADEASSPESPQRELSGYREALLEADQRGQYAAGVLVNGAPVQMLIDTGATQVCVSASTARRLALSPSGGRALLIQTANGQSTASPTILRSVSLDGL